MATTPAAPAADDAEARAGAGDVFKKTIIAAIAGQAPTAAGGVAITAQWVSLHNMPGGVSAHMSDANVAGTELAATGGYARKQVTWDTAGVQIVTSPADAAFTVAKISGNALTFDVGATTITHYAVYTAETGGQFLYGKPISAQITLSAPGKVTIVPSHSYGMSV